MGLLNNLSRNRVIILLLCIGCTSCMSSGQPSIGYIKHNVQNWKICTTDTIGVNIVQSEVNGQYTLEYVTDSRSESFKLSIADSTSLEYEIDGNRLPIKLIDFEYFEVNSKDYTIYKLASGYNQNDKTIFHFWSPEFGIILSRSHTWGSFKTFFTSDLSVQAEVDLLIKMILIHPSFYYGEYLGT